MTDPFPRRPRGDPDPGSPWAIVGWSIAFAVLLVLLVYVVTGG